MTSFTLKNVPPGLYDLLKKRAQHNRRSLNNEILFLLEESLGMREEPVSGLQETKTLYAVRQKNQIETAIEKDWNHPQEDLAWEHLQADNVDAYSLRGTPITYHAPTESVAEDDWEVLK